MNDPRHHDFDLRMRALHARAVEQLPSRTTYQLRMRREAAARASASGAPRSGGWWLAAAATAVFALAIGLRQPGPGSAPDPAGDALPPLAVATDAAETAAFEDSVAALDEDPDLYLWIASQDGQFLAME
ncbi:hypothetical protein [Luteimonas granuli]|uniref:DUF3619 family protein n=1 Tax=Luteimonas granuli TaxID=1176533 RepID=A0A518N5R0_9GAMM|nr:hypothetical protein [Luteimonas granuli]QDW67261.1 hypothetical protein FPZ22_10515 [Luteimonas granuli]